MVGCRNPQAPWNCVFSTNENWWGRGLISQVLFLDLRRYYSKPLEQPSAWAERLQRLPYKIETRSMEVWGGHIPPLPFLCGCPTPYGGNLHERKSERQGHPPAFKSQATEKEDEAKLEWISFHFSPKVHWGFKMAIFSPHDLISTWGWGVQNLRLSFLHNLILDWGGGEKKEETRNQSRLLAHLGWYLGSAPPPHLPFHCHLWWKNR